MIQRIALRDVLPNRYRNIDRYQISETKIEALLQSYAVVGFWDGSIQARPHPTQEGKYEIAFGHHRIEAARRHQLTEVGLVVATRSDADMLRMMADENREEFRGDHLVAIETVGATIEAFGRGEIELPAVDPKTPKNGIYVLTGERTYTAGTVARFLGWTSRDGDGVQPTRACRLAFEAYHERASIAPALQHLPEDDRTRQATTAVLSAVKSARTVATRAGQSPRDVEAAARRAAVETATQIRDGAMTTKVRKEAAEIGRQSAGVERSPLEISDFVRRRAAGLGTRTANLATEVDGLLIEILPYRNRSQIAEPTMDYLLDALREADQRVCDLFRKWIDRFEARAPVHKVTRPRRKRIAASMREARGNKTAADLNHRAAGLEGGTDEQKNDSTSGVLESIEDQRDHLIDLDRAVDVARHDVDHGVERLREAVRRRDAAAAHLAHLIGWQADEAA